MISPELEKLVEVGQLKREPSVAAEIEGLQRSGEARLVDASRACRSRAASTSVTTRRTPLHWPPCGAWATGRSRYLVFQALPHTLGLAAATWRILAKCHEIRNRAEYEGLIEVNDRLVTDLIAAAKRVLAALRASEGGKVSGLGS